MPTATEPPRIPYADPIPLAQIPRVGVEEWRRSVIDQSDAGYRITALFGQPRDDGTTRLYAIFSQADTSTITVLTTDVGDRYRALTPECPQAHWFEREIAEQWGVVPEGHPWLKPIRFHPSYRPGRDAWSRAPGAEILPSVTDFYRVEGPEIHEVAVGPVHAGVIEPGHFRFQCHGEHVFHLEISLGYQHRGIERALVGGPTKRTLPMIEAASGDTSVGHALAYSQAVEALAGSEAPIRSQVLRGIALELERLANHTGDLGALANDVGFLPTASYCGRLRGDFLNSTGLLCGNRFGRCLVRPGGVLWDLEPSRVDQMLSRLEPALQDVGGAAGVLWDSLTVQARFEDTGAVSEKDALAFGLVGVAARACGIDRDVRRDYPTGINRFTFIPVSTWHTGDVFARGYVRWLEIQRSGQFVLQQLRSLPVGSIRSPVGAAKPEVLVVSRVEGWRGVICHVAITDPRGQFAHYKIIDPSFRNWIGLSMSLRDQQISDFPLCNKSFNLSYCGHDL